MTERFRLSLSGMWLLVSLWALVFPIFLPSTMDNNVIGTATATMYIVSFPSSLLGLPLIFIVDQMLGVDPRSIQGMYVNLLMLFVLGLVQWFWIVPRVWRSEPAVQVLNLRASSNNTILTEGQMDARTEFFDARDTTPLERALKDED